MAKTTQSDPAETSGPAPAPVIKVTRARGTTSDIPRRTARPEAATVEPVSSPVVMDALNGPNGRPANVSIYQGGTDSIDADTVNITQGGASVVHAKRVEVRQGGIANAQAEDISVSMGGVALARADRVSVEMGGLGISFAREAHLTQGVARSVIAQDVRVDQGLVGTALAGRVTFERPSGVFLLIAGRTEGPIRAILDWRGAIAFGVAFGLLVGLVRRR